MTIPTWARLQPMQARDPQEPHRTATPLELFFDLVFVIAVAFAGRALHHAEAEDHISTGIAGYLMVFFAIWWAWMNFTWFATSFDTDDWLYRVLTVVQMSGVLVLASGVPAAMDDGDLGVVTLGYVIMRIAMVTQWLRAARSCPSYRTTALRYAGGIAAVQVLWVGRLFLPDEYAVATFLALVVCELAIPVFAESGRTTPWHPHHIAERFGLFTIILLGESLLASANAIVGAIEESGNSASLLALSACALVIVASMWWIYFAVPQHDAITSLRGSFTFGYAHYVIFASAGAVSAGIEVAVDVREHDTLLSEVASAATVTVPVSVFVLSVWLLAIRPRCSGAANVALPAGALVVVAATFVPYTMVVVAAVLAAMVAALVKSGRSRPHTVQPVRLNRATGQGREAP